MQKYFYTYSVGIGTNHCVKRYWLICKSSFYLHTSFISFMPWAHAKYCTLYPLLAYNTSFGCLSRNIKHFSVLGEDCGIQHTQVVYINDSTTELEITATLKSLDVR